MNSFWMEWWEQKPSQVIARGAPTGGIGAGIKALLARMFVIKENREIQRQIKGQVELVVCCLF